MQKVDETVRGLLRTMLDDSGQSWREVSDVTDDRITADVGSELDLVSLFALLSGLQGTGCRATVSPYESGSEDWGVSRGLLVTVLLPEGWWRS